MAKKKTWKLGIDDLKIDGLERAKAILDAYANYKIKVGVFGGQHHAENGTDYVDIAMLHEFGSTVARTFTYKGNSITVESIPARSFLRVPFEEIKKDSFLQEYFKYYLVEEIQAGKFTGKAYKLIGDELKNAIKMRFVSNDWLPNMNKKYIELKGSTKPLWDTGGLMGSINSEIVKKENK